MVGARSLAMALNRLIDARIDARNPRTATRELPAGLLTRRPGRCSSAPPRSRVFLVAVWQLDPLVRWLWPIPVLGFVVYPYLKRFTWLCHLWLGAVDGLAPVGAWVAITGKLPWQAWALGGAVAAWVAGFDLFYALFDLEVDRRAGAALVGDALRRARRVSRARGRCTSLTVALLVAAGLGLRRRLAYWLGVAAVARCSLYEHRSSGPATCAASTRRSSR